MAERAIAVDDADARRLPGMGGALRQLARWPARRWVWAAAATAGWALLLGAPTAVVPSGFFTRMTPVQWWNYPVLAVSAVLGGLVTASFVRSVSREQRVGRAVSGGVLSGLAIGCPVCNKLIVAVLGFSGALTWWAPLQPLLGVASVGLLGWALARRLADERACLVGGVCPSP